MLLTEYAKGNELDFRVESLKVYGVLMGLLGEERERRSDGFGLVSYRELWEGCKEAGGLIGRERVSGGSWCFCI